MIFLVWENELDVLWEGFDRGNELNCASDMMGAGVIDYVDNGFARFLLIGNDSQMLI